MGLPHAFCPCFLPAPQQPEPRLAASWHTLEGRDLISDLLSWCPMRDPCVASRERDLPARCILQSTLSRAPTPPPSLPAGHQRPAQSCSPEPAHSGRSSGTPRGALFSSAAPLVSRPQPFMPPWHVNPSPVCLSHGGVHCRSLHSKRVLAVCLQGCTFVEGVKEEVVLSASHALSLIAAGEGRGRMKAGAAALPPLFAAVP